MSEPLIPYTGGPLSGIAGLPQDAGGFAGPPDYQNADQIGQDTADSIQATGIPQPRPGVLEQTTKIDPETGEQTHRLTVTDAFFQQTMNLARLGAQATQAYDQQVQMLKARQRFQQQNPIITQVGKIASLAAAGYQNPNFRGSALVRAAGLAGMEQFQGTPESIQGQIAQIESQKIVTQVPVITAMNDLARLQETGQTLAVAQNKNLETMKAGWRSTAAAAKITPASATAAAQDLYAQTGDKAGALRFRDELIQTSRQAQAVQDARDQFQVEKANKAATEADYRQSKAIQASTERMLAGFNHQERMKLLGDIDVQASKKTPDIQKLEGLNTLEMSLGGVKKAIVDFQNNTGPFAGRVLSAKQKIGILNQETSKFTNQINLLVPEMVQAYGEGARGYMKYGLEFNKGLKPNVNFNVQQNLGNIDALLQDASNRRVGTATGWNKLQVAARPNLFAGDYAKALDAAAAVPDVVSEIAAKAGTGGKAKAPATATSPAPKASDFKGLAPGKGLKGPDGTIWVLGADGVPTPVK